MIFSGKTPRKNKLALVYSLRKHINHFRDELQARFLAERSNRTRPFATGWLIIDQIAQAFLYSISPLQRML